jgi:hypothetical protein
MEAAVTRRMPLLGLDSGPNGHGLSKLWSFESYVLGPMVTLSPISWFPAALLSKFAWIRAGGSTLEHPVNPSKEIAGIIKSKRK